MLCTKTVVQSTFSNFSLKKISNLNYFVKTFTQDCFQINSNLGTIMTFHKGSSNSNSKVHIEKNELAFSTANYKLYIEDGIMSESLKIDSPQDWADFVFHKDYSLKNLADVEKFIHQNQHLPDVPSEKEIKEKGYYDQHEINKVLLQKIEELTLYIIEQNKKIEKVQQELLDSKIK